MLDIEYIKDLKQHSRSLGDILGELEQVNMQPISLSIKAKSKGIRFICKHIYSVTWRYLEQIKEKEKDFKPYYTEDSLISDLLMAQYLFSSVCDNSFLYYEDVLMACDDYIDDYFKACEVWKHFHILKIRLEQLSTLHAS